MMTTAAVMFWAGTAISTALPSKFHGAIVYKMPKVGIVVGFKLPIAFNESLKAIVSEYPQGGWDKYSELWYAKVGGVKEVGILINKVRALNLGSIEVAVESDLNEAVIKSLKNWVEGSKPKTDRAKVFEQLNAAKIGFIHQELADKDRVYIKYQDVVADDEAYEIDIDIAKIKEIGFIKDGALWEMYFDKKGNKI